MREIEHKNVQQLTVELSLDNPEHPSTAISPRRVGSGQRSAKCPTAKDTQTDLQVTGPQAWFCRLCSNNWLK